MKLRFIRALGILILGALFASAAHAQSRERSLDDLETDPTKTTVPRTVDEARERSEASLRRSPPDLAGPVDPDGYRVGPGDVLQLSLWGGISRVAALEVGPEGTVMLPSVGSLRVDGLSLRAARAEIMNKLRGEFRGVNMDVRLARPRRFIVYVTGMVKEPGPIEANGASRVGDVIVPAQLHEDASRRRIELRHRDGSMEIADLDLFLRAGRADANPWLRDGDVIYVPAAREHITIQGAVAEGGQYELGAQDSLLTLLRLGGGTIPAADTSRALFIRWTDPTLAESLWVNIGDIRSRKYNPGLRNGDRFYVFFLPQYQVQHEVTVTGEVMRPGTYPIREGRDRVTDIVRAAGGFLPAANLSAIRVMRPPKEAAQSDPELQRLLRLSRMELTESEYEVLRTRLAGQRSEYRVDWNRLQSEGPPLDILLVGGDRIEVDRLVSSIRVDGEVTRPGFIAYRSGLPVEEYIRNAGGYSRRAWKSKVRVTRSVTGQTLLARDVTKLDPGDLVWVPEKPDIGPWAQFRTLLTSAAEVATVIIAVKAIQD